MGRQKRVKVSVMLSVNEQDLTLHNGKGVELEMCGKFVVLDQLLYSSTREERVVGRLVPQVYVYIHTDCCPMYYNGNCHIRRAFSNYVSSIDT